MSENQTDNLEPLKVGDKLAFRANYGKEWRIEEVSKITPSGRIVCEHYTLNPDLSVRGDRGYSGPLRGHRATPEILKEYREQRDRQFVRFFKFDILTPGQTSEVAILLRRFQNENEKAKAPGQTDNGQ